MKILFIILILFFAVVAYGGITWKDFIVVHNNYYVVEPPISAGDALLLESGDTLLLESGDKLLLE